MGDRMPPRPTPEVWSAEYVVTFTSDEIALLTTEPDLLSPPRRQRAHMLRLALRPEQCPECRFVLCPRSAWTGEEFDPCVNGDGPGYACPMCQVVLVHVSEGVESHRMEVAPEQPEGSRL